MLETELAKLIKNAWKQLALADQTDADEVKAVLIELLGKLDKGE